MNTELPPQRGGIHPRALAGKVLLINGGAFGFAALVLAGITRLVPAGASVTGLLALIFAGIGVLEALAGVVIWRWPGGESPPTRLINQFYAALERQDYTAAARYLSLAAGGPFGQMTTEAEFMRRAREADTQRGRIVTFGLLGLRSNPARRVYTIRVRRATGAYRVRLLVARQGAEWRIVGFDRL